MSLFTGGLGTVDLLWPLVLAGTVYFFLKYKSASYAAHEGVPATSKVYFALRGMVGDVRALWKELLGLAGLVGVILGLQWGSPLYGVVPILNLDPVMWANLTAMFGAVANITGIAELTGTQVAIAAGIIFVVVLIINEVLE